MTVIPILMYGITFKGGIYEEGGGNKGVTVIHIFPRKIMIEDSIQVSKNKYIFIIAFIYSTNLISTADVEHISILNIHISFHFISYSCSSASTQLLTILHISMYRLPPSSISGSLLFAGIVYCIQFLFM